MGQFLVLSIRPSKIYSLFRTLCMTRQQTNSYCFITKHTIFKFLYIPLQRLKHWKIKRFLESVRPHTTSAPFSCLPDDYDSVQEFHRIV